MASAQQEQDWWFDVEIILFKRIVDTQIDENFSKSLADIDIAATRDLMSLPLLKQADPLMRIRRTLSACATEPSTERAPLKAPSIMRKFGPRVMRAIGSTVARGNASCFS